MFITSAAVNNFSKVFKNPWKTQRFTKRKSKGYFSIYLSIVKAYISKPILCYMTHYKTWESVPLVFVSGLWDMQKVCTVLYFEIDK